MIVDTQQQQTPQPVDPATAQQPAQANLFSTQDQPNLFSGVSDQQKPVAQTMPSDPSRQGSVAALSTIPVTSTPEETYSIYSQNSAALTNLLKQEGDDNLRHQAALQQSVTEATALAQVHQQAALAGDTATTQAAGVALKSSMAQTIAQRQQYALENKAIENIQDLAAQGNDVQANIQRLNIYRPSAEAANLEITTKRLILQRAIENAQVDKDHQGWFGDALDFVSSAVPLHQSYSQSHVAADIGTGLHTWYDWLASGTTLRNESANLYSLPTADFADYVQNHLVQNAYSMSGIFGWHNQTERLNMLTQMRDTQPAWQINGTDAIDNIGLLPIGKIGKLVSIPGLLARQGARSEMSDLVGQAATELIANGEGDATAKTGLSQVEIEQNLLPTALRPTTVIEPTGRSALLGGTSHIPFEPVKPPEVNIGPYETNIPELEQPTKQQTISFKPPVDAFEPGPLPPAANGPVTKVTVAADASEAAERGRQLLEGITDINQSERFATDAEKQAALANYTNQLRTTYGKALKDVSVPGRVPMAGGGSYVTSLDLMLGKDTGHGFATETQAAGYLDSIGEAGQTVQDESGHWFGKVTKMMPETGLYSTPIAPRSTNVVSRFLLGARQIGDDLLNSQANTGLNQNARLQKQVVKRYQPLIDRLTGNEKLSLDHVLTAGQNHGVFFTDDGLNQLYDRAFKRLPTPNEQAAYHAARDLNDISYALRNDDMYKFNALKGYESVYLDTGMGVLDNDNAIVNRGGFTKTGERVFDVSDGVHYHEGNPVTEEVQERWKNRGAFHVTLQEPYRLGDGTTVREMIVNPKDIEVSPLNRTQLGYAPGLNRLYKSGMYFAKQTAADVQADTGKAFLKNPTTFIAGTKAQVDFWASKMEEARMAVKNGADAGQLDEIFQGQAGLPSGEDFLNRVSTNEIHPDYPIGTYYDRDMPTEYTAQARLNLPDQPADLDWMRTNGRTYYSTRGERLSGWDGQPAPVLDPWDTLNRGLQSVASLSSLSDYKMSAVERFVTTFRAELNTDLLPRGASDYQIFRDATVRGDRPNALVQKIEAQRDIIKRTLNWRSQWDLQADDLTRRLSDWIEGSEPGTVRHEVGNSVNDWFRTKNPVMALKGAAFDMKLGLFNIAQLPLQIATAVAATTIDPVNGLKGWAMYPFLRTYITGAGTDNLLDLMVKNGTHTLGGFTDAAEFKAFMKQSRGSGFLNVAGAHTFSYDYGLHFGSSVLQRGREAGRFFFNEPEIVNRVTAQRIAWADSVKKFGTDFNSIEFKNNFAQKSEDFAFNMSKGSEAYWQKGIFSVPTQFMAYNARMMEAMLGKQFTTAQKLRLIAGQTFLYGSAGFPVAGVISDLVKRNTAGTDFNTKIDSLYGFADRGLLDEMIYHVTGADVQAGEKAGTGNSMTDIVKDLFGWSSYGEKSFAEVAGGAAFSTLVDTGGTLASVIKYSAAESGAQDNPLTKDAILHLAQNVSTISNVTKAMMIWKYGTMVSNKGTTIAADVPSQDAMFQIFGMAPGEGLYVSSLMEYTQDNKKAVEDAAKTIQNYRTRFVNEPDNRVDITNEINAFTRMLPEQVRIQALRKAGKVTSPGLYQGIQQQVAKSRRLEATIQEVQDRDPEVQPKQFEGAE